MHQARANSEVKRVHMRGDTSTQECDSIVIFFQRKCGWLNLSLGTFGETGELRPRYALAGPPSSLSFHCGV
ncbi:unnamed protein product [Chondrus crispus]|uniref:Uncharacterized protein n=1 Tax=Chondrus crispus TaxID=2769 RepID=R7Q7B7_CHOCR|nr:unnamed protein product [Chondrus crispus]CDF33914.1 unnamed protein product [Chondrus crispus]|eukprot:XP_005713732.1 unnamed protein product [Chondrus crispus]